MNRLPFFTVVMLATGILVWNFSFYRGYYQAQAAGSVRTRSNVSSGQEAPRPCTSPGTTTGERPH